MLPEHPAHDFRKLGDAELRYQVGGHGAVARHMGGEVVRDVVYLLQVELGLEVVHEHLRRLSRREVELGGQTAEMDQLLGGLGPSNDLGLAGGKSHGFLLLGEPHEMAA